MSGGAVTLRVANLSDLPFIMATERMPEFDRMVGRWAEDEHRAALARTNHAYLLGINAAGRPGAFSIIRDNKAEPALLLTPPNQPSEEDDGLLTASEAAQAAGVNGSKRCLYHTCNSGHSADVG